MLELSVQVKFSAMKISTKSASRRLKIIRVCIAIIVVLLILLILLFSAENYILWNILKKGRLTPFANFFIFYVPGIIYALLAIIMTIVVTRLVNDINLQF